MIAGYANIKHYLQQQQNSSKKKKNYEKLGMCGF